MACAFLCKELDKDDPWTGISSTVTFAAQAAVCNTACATPSQLAFHIDTAPAAPVRKSVINLFS